MRPLTATATLSAAAIDSKYVRELIIVCLAYTIGGRIGLAVPFTSGNVSAVWPAAGIAVASLLLVGYRVWPGIAAGAFLVNLFTPIPAGAALALSIGNTAGPLGAVWLVRRVPGFRPSLGRLDDVLWLLLVAAPASGAISATIGVSTLFLTDVDPWSGFWPAWLVWWVGDAMGVLVVTPLALMLATSVLPEKRRIPEFAALLGIGVVTSLVIFDQRVALGSQKDVLAFLVLPLVLWGAMRFEILGAACVTGLIACVAVWETASGSGPFVRYSTLQNATMLQSFIAVTTFSGLTLAAAIVERAQLIRQQAEREGIALAEKRYRDIVETANDGIWMLDAQLTTVFVNARMAELLGYAPAEMSGRPLADFVSNDTWGDTQAGLKRRGPLRDLTQRRFKKKDGSELLATVSRTRAFADDGTFTGVLKMVKDIGAQRRADVERQDAQKRVVLLSKVVEQTADSVLITDKSGRIEYVNPAFETTTGYSRDEALGRKPSLLKSGHHEQAFYADMWTRLLGGDSYRGVLLNRKKTGDLYWANQTITPITDAAGHITHFVSLLKDVTDVRKYHEQEVQLRLARAVQQRFSPRRPHLAGFDIAAASHPAAETGGDCFDFIEAPDGVLYVSVGDVSGHGFDAALIMALTRAYMRAFAACGWDVGEILTRLNVALLADIQDNRYVTMLLARIETDTRSATYASAGHIPGILLDMSGGADARLDSTGVPLGLFADATFPTRGFQFGPQHILVLGTDGATETTDSSGAEFGQSGVADYVRAHAEEPANEIAAGIYAAVRSFGGAEAQHDDITSVILKSTGECVALR